MSVSDFFLEKLRAYDPSLETDRDFVQQVLVPLRRYLGESTPTTDITSILRTHLEEEFPDFDGSVLADMCGRVAALLAVTVRAEISAGLSRGNFADTSTMTLQDMRHNRDAFFVEPSIGSYAQGVMRAYFTSAQSVRVLPNALILIPARAGKPDRRYRPSQGVVISADAMRQQRDAGMFYVDIPVTAAQSGTTWNAQISEGIGITGIAGAARVAIVQNIRGGEDADDAAGFSDRISTSLRLRTVSTVGGAEYVLPTLGIPRAHVATAGDSLMIRDRIFGVSNIAGIPGGYTQFSDEHAGDFVSIGLAWDVYIPPDTTLISQSLTNSVPLENTSSFRGDWRITVTRTGSGIYELSSSTPLFGLTVSAGEAQDGGRFPGPVDNALISVGDFVTCDSYLSVASDIRRLSEITSVTDAWSAVMTTDQDSVWNPLDNQTLYLRFYKKLNASVGATALSLPIRFDLARNSDGQPAYVGNLQAETQIRTSEPLVVGGFGVAQRSNVLSNPTEKPVFRLDRMELLDSVTNVPTQEYIYPAHPMLVEFIGPAVNSTPGLVGPVRVRVHLMGPMAMNAIGQQSLGDVLNVIEVEKGDARYAAYEWPMVTAEVVAVNSEGSTLVLSGMFTSDPLRDFSNNPVLDGNEPRILRAGDHILLGNVALPIVAIVGLDTIRVAASDLPAGAEYAGARILQGTSRSQQLQRGIQEEGTYYFDVFVGLREPTSSPADSPPPANTLAVPSLLPFQVGNQGYSIVGDFDATYLSADEKPTLVIHNSHVCDSKEVLARSFSLHGPSSAKLLNLQSVIGDDRTRPIVSTGLAKMLPPSWVTMSIYYEGDFEPEDAFSAIATALTESDNSGRVELSDLTAAVVRRGAVNTVTGRMFVLQQDSLRRWTWFATRDAVALTNENASSAIPWSVTCTRLRPRPDSERTIYNPRDSANHLSSYTYRHGGFRED